MKKIFLSLLFVLSMTFASYAEPQFDNDGKPIYGYDTQVIKNKKQIVTQYTNAGDTGAGRPQGCPKLWCGCWLKIKKGLQNYALNLDLAMNWRKVGSRAAPGCIGCVAVMGRRGGGHVGEVIGWNNGNPVIQSGNNNKRVGIQEYSAKRIIEYRSI